MSNWHFLTYLDINQALNVEKVIKKAAGTVLILCIFILLWDTVSMIRLFNTSLPLADKWKFYVKWENSNKFTRPFLHSKWKGKRQHRKISINYQRMIFISEPRRDWDNPNCHTINYEHKQKDSGDVILLPVVVVVVMLLIVFFLSAYSIDLVQQKSKSVHRSICLSQ